MKPKLLSAYMPFKGDSACILHVSETYCSGLLKKRKFKKRHTSVANTLFTYELKTNTITWLEATIHEARNVGRLHHSEWKWLEM